MTLLSGPDHRFELVNQAYITLLDGRDVLGRTVAEAVPEAGPQGFIELLDTVYRTGEAFKSRGARLALTGGSGQLVERYLDFIYQPIRDETGAITGIFVEGSDTTDRTLAERDFARTERLLRSLIETGPGYFYFKDVEGRMLMANQAIIELVGKPWSEIEGRTDVEFLEDKSQGRVVMENDRAILAAGMAQEIEERVTNAEGEPRLFLSTKTPLRGEDGEIIGLVGVSVDITARKELETQLQAKGKPSCQVSGARPFGRTTSGEDLVEVACSDGGPGWVLQYPATGGSNPNTLLNCAQAAQMGGGGGCQLPTNMKH